MFKKKQKESDVTLQAFIRYVRHQTSHGMTLPQALKALGYVPESVTKPELTYPRTAVYRVPLKFMQYNGSNGESFFKWLGDYAVLSDGELRIRAQDDVYQLSPGDYVCQDCMGRVSVYIEELFNETFEEQL